MLRTSQIRSVAKEIASASETGLDAYREGRITDEPSITDRILGAIEERLRHRKKGGVVWEAATLRSSKGSGAEEARHGADLMGVIKIALPEFRVDKGFLAQAKRIEPGTDLTSREWSRLQEQCELMLERTSDCFVFVYSKELGIRVVPAIEIAGTTSNTDLSKLYDRSFQSFFELFIECFIGDGRLNKAHVGVLDELAGLSVSRTLILKATAG